MSLSVFTCNGDNSKNGSSYLMVQYFRNYIVRPVGSLSATSTVDSLSSSCICIANEANTLVPPPYSRAASPDLSLTTHTYGIPRSASQQGCSLENYTYQSVPVFSNDDLSTTSASNNALRESESVNLPTIHTSNGGNSNTMHLSRSDQQFKQTMITHSISNLSIPVTGVDVVTISQTINTQNTNSNSTNSYSSMNAIYNMQQQLPCDSFSEESPINGDILQKFNDMRRYVNSNSGSAISSLANMGTPDSPPRPTSPTSPTDEVKELLQQIRQLQKENSDDRIEDPPNATSTKPIPTPSIRPSSLHRKDFFAKKVRYVSITNSVTKNIRSPLGSGCSSLLGKGRSRIGWISKSAPTTPGTALPPCFLDDDSPLLNEQDEDVETN